MNESPKSVKDLLLQNEALAEDNDTLYKTNEELILEIRKLKKDLEEVEIHEEMLVEENHRLLSEHRDLTNKINFQKRQISALKFRCSDLSKRNTALESEITDMKLTHKMLNSEEAGRAFAQELLGKPMTKADIEEEKMIADGEAHYERFAFLGDDF